MDIVIPLHEWSGTKNAELKYALRSFEKFLPKTDRLILIGFKPDWITNATLIPFRDDPQPAFREANIFLKLQQYLKTIGSEQEEFIYTNDDHFLLKPFDPRPPYPHKGTLLESFNKRRPDDPYRKCIDNTIKITSNKLLDFDVHAPMLINSSIFTDVFARKRVNWATKYGYLLKTLYAEGFRGYQVLDLKIMQASDKDANEMLEELKAADLSFFTTSDQAFNPTMNLMLELLLPEKSKYEK